MAESGLPALDIDPVTFGARANSAWAQSGLAQLSLDRAKASQPQVLANDQAELQKETALAPLAVHDAQTKSRLEDMAAADESIAQVVRDARAADPQDAPTIWDNGMKAAAANGAAVANQYIGHYRPELAERLSDVYGPQGQKGGSGLAKAPATGLTEVARTVAQMPGPQIAQSLKNYDLTMTSWDKLRANPNATADDLEAEINLLNQAGVPVLKSVPGLDFSRKDPASFAMNYAAVNSAIERMKPFGDALRDRAAVLGLGGTPPAPAPQGTSTYIGVDPKTQQPIYHNSTTNQETVGEHPISPKPSAALSLFQFKQKAFTDAGYSEGDALQMANGRKNLPPERLMAIAGDQANKELADITLGGAQVPNPEAWVRAKTQENYARLTATTVTPAGGGGRQAVPDPTNLPKRALDTVKAGAGKVVTFNNGLKYKWDAQKGRAVQVQ